MSRVKLVDFVIHFMQEIDKEIAELKMAVNSRARNVAQEFLKQVKVKKSTNKISNINNVLCSSDIYQWHFLLYIYQWKTTDHSIY